MNLMFKELRTQENLQALFVKHTGVHRPNGQHEASCSAQAWPQKSLCNLYLQCRGLLCSLDVAGANRDIFLALCPPSLTPHHEAFAG